MLPGTVSDPVFGATRTGSARGRRSGTSRVNASGEQLAESVHWSYSRWQARGPIAAARPMPSSRCARNVWRRDVRRCWRMVVPADEGQVLPALDDTAQLGIPRPGVAAVVVSPTVGWHGLRTQRVRGRTGFGPRRTAGGRRRRTTTPLRCRTSRGRVRPSRAVRACRPVRG